MQQSNKTISKKLEQELTNLLSYIYTEISSKEQIPQHFFKKVEEKYGEYGVLYFKEKLEKSLQDLDFMFENELELLVEDLESETPNEVFIKKIKQIENEQNDEVYQRFLEIKKEIKELNQKIEDLNFVQKQTQEEGFKKELYWLEQELKQKQIMLDRRSENYYENKNFYAEAEKQRTQQIKSPAN